MAYGLWRDVEVAGPEAPLEFKGASAAFVGTRCFIFGGYGGGFSDETHCLECAEPLAPEWSVLQETSDEKPPRRAHHTTWAHGGGVWVFGGASSRGYLNDVWRLTLEGGKHPRGRWRECACVGEKPVPREGHTGVQIGTSLVVVGGYDGVSWRSDSYALNLDTLVWWRVVDQGAPNAMMGRSGGAQRGNQPVSARRDVNFDLAGHAATKAPGDWDAIFIFGGYGADGCIPSHSFVACLEVDEHRGTGSWIPTKPQGVTPSDRYGLSAVTNGHGIYIFGGTGPAEDTRAAAAPDRGAVCHNDCAILSLQQPHRPVWRRDRHGHGFPGEPPLPRHGHASAIKGRDVFIVGGSTSGSYCKKDPAPRLLNDVHLLTLSATAQS